MIIDQYKQCGGSGTVLITNIPSIVPRITSTLYNTVMVLVPVILIIMGSIDMTKAVISNEGDAILKSAILFGKRALASVLVFMAPSVILGIFHMVDGMDNFDSKYKTCLDCILGDSSCPDVKFIQNN